MTTISTPNAGRTYHIRLNPYFYAGTCHAPESGPIRDEAGDILQFRDIEAARAWLATYLGNVHLVESDCRHDTYSVRHAGPPFLSHGQYAQTDYTIERSRYRAHVRLVA